MSRDAAALERERTALLKINRVLMERVENAVNSSGSDYAIFEQNILLQRRVEEHTAELEDRHRRLAALLEEQQRIGRELKEGERRAASQRSALAQLMTAPAVVQIDLPRALDLVAERLCSTMEVARAGVWKWSEDGFELHCQSLYDAATQRHSSGERLETAVFPAYFEAIRAENRIAAEDARADPRTRELAEGYLKPLGIVSMLDAGILIEGNLAGVICLEHIGKRRRWHPDEESFVSAIAAVVAQLLVNAKRKETEAALRRSEERLAEINACLSSLGPDYEANVGQLTALCGRLLGAVCALYNRMDSGLLCSLGQWQTPPDFDPKDRPDGHICYDVIRGGGTEPLVVRNLPATSYAASDPNVTRYARQSYAGHPVRCGDEVVGSVCAVFQSDFDPTPDDLRVLSLIATALSREEDRQRAARVLRESSERLATVMDSVEAFIYIADMQTHELLFVNEYGQRSWEGQDFHGQPCWQVLQGLDGPCPFCTNDRLLTPEGQPAGVVEWEFQNHRNGRWYDLRDRAIRWTDGRLVRMEIATDITERKQAEEALREAKEEAEENEARFRALHNASFGGIAIHDQGMILDCNQGLSEMSGYSQEELIGMDGLRLIAESSREWVRTNIVRGNEKPCEAVGVRKNGEEFPVRLEARSIPYHGKQVRSVEFRDITEEKLAAAALRESEEKFSTLFASMTETVVLYDLVNDALGHPVDYRVVDCNRAFLLQTNIAREAALGRLATDVFGTLVPPYLEEYSQVVQTGEPCRIERHLVHPDIYLSTSVVPMGRNRFAAISSDVTAIKKAQQMVAVKNKELERIVYVASHDLRSPLVNVDGYGRELEFALTEIIQTLECAEPSPVQLEQKLRDLLPDMTTSLRHIRGSSKQMDALLKGLLKLSRSGRAVLAIARLDMQAVLAQAVASFQYQFREAGAELRLGDLPPCRGDAMQVGQVFSNLIGNALKYRDPSRPCVVSVSGAADGDRCIYVVEDNGMGIPPEHQEKIFDLFHRIDPSGTEGEGLGLTIVRQIVNRLEGEIRVESTPGRGSRFIVTLPVEGDPG